VRSVMKETFPEGSWSACGCCSCSHFLFSVTYSFFLSFLPMLRDFLSESRVFIKNY